MAAKTAPAPQGREAHKMHRNRLGGFNQQNTTHEALIDQAHAPEDLLDPNYWWDHNKRLKVWDLIECRCEDSTWRRAVRVMGVDTKMKRVIVVPEGDVVEYEPAPIPDGYELDFVGFKQGWRVMQDGRDTPIASGFATHVEAAHWLNADRAPPAKKPAKAEKAGKPAPAEEQPQA